MADEMLTISKHDLIEILTKSDIFNSGGIEVALSRNGLKGVLAEMMVEIDNSSSRADHYKGKCSMLESLVYKYEDIITSETDRWFNI